MSEIADILVFCVDKIFTKDEIKQHFLKNMRQDQELLQTDFMWKIGMMS
jgi:hypothetical protein